MKVATVAKIAALLIPQVLVTQHVFAKDVPACSVTDEQFLKQLELIKDWTSLYALYKRNLPRYPDDGFYAEGYSDVVAKLLVNRWIDVSKFGRLARRDEDFRNFVYRHIDSTTDPDDLKRVLENARTECPTSEAPICVELARRAEAAIADL